jgi:hypothetical protein
MRIPAYLSPSQVALWYSDREEYYLKHLSNVRVPRLLQTTYMSIGSAFDAYVKSSMFAELFGQGSDPRFEFEAIFEDQVEEHNRDWAKEHGKYVFECYKLSGAYADLMELLHQSKYAPQFEFKIEGKVQGIPLLGKPDLRFIHPSDAHVILDWKVNGYCSKSPTSPCKNYRLIRDGWDSTTAKPSRGNKSPHKDYIPMIWKDVEIHRGWLEDANSDWADQLAIYSWMLGEDVGNENVIVCIDQIVAKPADPKPLLRIANHRARISKIHQENLFQRINAVWSAITNGHIFTDLPLEESKALCDLLDRQAIVSSLDTPEQQYINEITRHHRFGK